MHIRIPQHTTRASLSSVRTRDMIRGIMVISVCKNFRERPGHDRTIELLAEKKVRNGRIHVKAECMAGHYVLDIHYDSEKHLKRPDRITRGKSFSVQDCLEVRRFLNQFVLPIILANRTHYHFRVRPNDSWIYSDTLLDENAVHV